VVALVRPADTPTFQVDDHLHIKVLATPSCGTRETSVWRITMAPGNPGTAHRLDHEQLFVALSGSAVAQLDTVELDVAAGDVLVVPAGAQFCMSNLGDAPFVALCIQPVGALVSMPELEPFVLAWAR
jgi:mannose-6-phosphate isomerase-like protein (cupin superfamily)